MIRKCLIWSRLGKLGSQLGVNCATKNIPIPPSNEIWCDFYFNESDIPSSFDARSAWPRCVSPIRNQVRLQIEKKITFLG